MRIKSSERLYVDGREYAAGDIIEIEDKLGQLYVYARRAEAVEETEEPELDEAKSKPRYKTRRLKAEE